MTTDTGEVDGKLLENLGVQKYTDLNEKLDQVNHVTKPRLHLVIPFVQCAGLVELNVSCLRCNPGLHG